MSHSEPTEKLSLQIDSPSVAIRKRYKKRQKIKLKHAERQILKRKKTLHDCIDSNLEAIHRNYMETVARDEANKNAKQILSEIHKKKSDALKYIELFKALTILRDLRKNRETSKKLPNESAWNEKLKNLSALWEDTLEEYNKEEAKLKSILAYNSQSLEDQWREVIFGDKEREKKAVDPKSLHKFFKIRRIWDSYTVPDNSIGSSIPSGWILPPNNPTLQWTAHMFK